MSMVISISVVIVMMMMMMMMIKRMTVIMNTIMILNVLIIDIATTGAFVSNVTSISLSS